jgi:hypothetical protein
VGVRYVALASGSYDLSVSAGQIWLSSPASGPDCVARAVEPTDLSLGRAERYDCGDYVSFPADPDVRLQVLVKENDEIRAVITDPATGRTTYGPVVMALLGWSWAHSGTPVLGGGYIWAYDLAAKPAPSYWRSRPPPAASSTASPWTPVPTRSWRTTTTACGWPRAPGAAGSARRPAPSTTWPAPGAGRATVALRAGDADQWFAASATSVFADLLDRTPSRTGYRQSIWRLDGASARVAYNSPATLLPAPDFAPGTGYVVAGSPTGLYTLTDVSGAGTPVQIGQCPTGTTVRVVRVSTSTGLQTVVTALPKGIVPSGCPGYLSDGQAVVADDAMYLVEGPGSSYGAPYMFLVRVPLGSPLRAQAERAAAAMVRAPRTAGSPATSSATRAIALESPEAMTVARTWSASRIGGPASALASPRERRSTPCATRWLRASPKTAPAPARSSTSWATRALTPPRPTSTPPRTNSERLCGRTAPTAPSGRSPTAGLEDCDAPQQPVQAER